MRFHTVFSIDVSHLESTNDQPSQKDTTTHRQVTLISCLIESVFRLAVSGIDLSPRPHSIKER